MPSNKNKEQSWAAETYQNNGREDKKSAPIRSISTTSTTDTDLLSFTSSAAISDFQTHKCHPVYDIRWFVFFFYLVVLSFYAVLAHTVSISRTLEKRFALSSTEVGFISSTNDIVNLTLILFLGYLGGKVNKPRLLAVLGFFGGTGCCLFALPYALYPRTISEETAPNRTNEEFLCGANTSQIDNLCDNEMEESLIESRAAYGIMLLASALSGVGTSGLSALSVSYIDDNLSRGVAALYIGILSSAYPFGSFVGFTLASVTLQLPENLEEAYFDKTNPGFIGNWWLLYLVYGGMVYLSALAMLFCPKHLPHYYKMKARLRKLKRLKQLSSVDDVDDEKLPKNLKETIKSLVNSFSTVLQNIPYLTLVLSALCCFYILPSIYQQVPKYLQINFHIDAANASVYTGICGALSSALSLFGGGYMIKRLNMQTRGIAILFILSIVGTQLSITAMLPWECDQTYLAGGQAKKKKVPTATLR